MYYSAFNFASKEDANPCILRYYHAPLCFKDPRGVRFPVKDVAIYSHFWCDLQATFYKDVNLFTRENYKIISEKLSGTLIGTRQL